jgi:hypothetical protein
MSRLKTLRYWWSRGYCQHERFGVTQILTQDFSESEATARCTNSTASPHRFATRWETVRLLRGELFKEVMRRFEFPRRAKPSRGFLIYCEKTHFRPGPFCSKYPNRCSEVLIIRSSCRSMAKIIFDTIAYSHISSTPVQKPVSSMDSRKPVGCRS